MEEYLARVSWESVLEYRDELRQDDDVGEVSRRLPLTNQYGSNQPVLDKLVFGDGLWLFTAPVFGQGASQRILPPSVLGRISITHQWNDSACTAEPASGAPACTPAAPDTRRFDVSGLQYEYWRCGTPGDALPIHNAFWLFKSLTFKGRVKQVSPTCERCDPTSVSERGPFGHLMQHFQSIRTLTDDSVTRLARLQGHVADRRTLFLSHRHDEAGPLVSEIAGHLWDHALCWWDVQALPQSVRYADRVLQDMLSDGIRQAGWFVAFLTPGYAATKWTAEEWENAQMLGTRFDMARRLKILPVLLGGSLRGGREQEQPITVGEDARAIAVAIRERLAP